MNAELLLRQITSEVLASLYAQTFSEAQIAIQKTRPEFTGDFTIVTFPFAKSAGKSPVQTGDEVGAKLKEHKSGVVSDYNVINGFLNIILSEKYWMDFFAETLAHDSYGKTALSDDSKSVMIEYPSPNTNKPLHLGHLRNIFLGASIQRLLEASGNKVVHTCLYNDRGTNICKSMLAWQKWGNGATPQSAGVKGDHLVGDYYVKFDLELKAQLKPLLKAVYDKHDYSQFTTEEQEKLTALIPKRTQLLELLNKELQDFDESSVSVFGTDLLDLSNAVKKGEKRFKDLGKELEKFEKPDAKQKELHKKIKNSSGIEAKLEEVEDAIKEIVKRHTPIMKEVHKMLEEWEAGNEEVLALWRKMNAWVYEGFDATYKQLGISPEKFYYESDVYKLGKETVEEGLRKGVFYRKEDNSVWIDLTGEGLDHRVVLRSNGTSVYITQDIAVANEKEREFKIDQSIYVVGNEQDYHFKVLFLILKKLGRAYADNLYHLSYGMVELPSGKMKSREGTVVDADDLIEDVIDRAAKATSELGKTADMKEEDKQRLYHMLGMGALKYFILKVDPKKKMLFNPEESVDLHGNTGPFIQYSHARIRSVIYNSGISEKDITSARAQNVQLEKEEKTLLRLIHDFPPVVLEAARSYSPALVANFAYEVARAYNQFYHEHSVLKANDEETKRFRLQLSYKTGKVLKTAMSLLGIEVPERM